MAEPTRSMITERALSATGEGQHYQDLPLRLKKFRAVWLKPAVRDLREFFQLVAKVSREAFEAQFVTVWDNNVYGNCLVLLASDPALPGVIDDQTVPRENSYTG